MEIGLCSISAREDPLAEIMEAASRVGYDGLEVRGKEPHVTEGTPTEARAIRRRAAEHSLAIFSYGSYLRAGTESFSDRLQPELAFAENLDADLIRVWAGTEEYEDRTGAHWDAVVSNLRSLADRAERCDVAVTVERHYGTLTNRTAGAAALLEDVAHDNCGLNWQAYCEQDPESHTNSHRTEAAVVADARRLAPLSNNVHVQSWPSPDARQRCLVTESFYDWEQVLEQFRNAGYDGVLELEFTSAEAAYNEGLSADLEALRQMVDRYEL
jgi:sugar phosphate isomerase/epimerase